MNLKREVLKRTPARDMVRYLSEALENALKDLPVDEYTDAWDMLSAAGEWLQGTEVKSDAERNGVFDSFNPNCDAGIEHPERPQDCELFESTGIHCKDCIKADELSTVDSVDFPSIIRRKGD